MGSCECCEGSGKDVRVSFCPSCKSRSVGYVFGVGNLFGVMPKMKCRDCEFEMASFPVLTINEKDLAKAIKKIKGRKRK